MCGHQNSLKGYIACWHYRFFMVFFCDCYILLSRNISHNLKLFTFLWNKTENQRWSRVHVRLLKHTPPEMCRQRTMSAVIWKNYLPIWCIVRFIYFIWFSIWGFVYFSYLWVWGSFLLFLFSGIICIRQALYVSRRFGEIPL